MPLDDTTFNYGNGGGRNDRWNRICERMNRMLDKLKRYANKIERMQLDDEEKKVRKSLALIGAGIAEAKILAEEGGRDYRNLMLKSLVDARIAKDSVYGTLLGDRKFSLEIMDELRNNPLAIKARRVYEIGVSNIEKYLN